MITVRIRILKTVTPMHPRLTDRGTELIEGRTYEAFRNHHGDLCGICANGEPLPVHDGEFEWVIDEERSASCQT